MIEESEILKRVLDYIATAKSGQTEWHKDKTRSAWTDAVILSTVNAIELLQDSMSFYLENERREPKDLLSYYMEKPSGLADTVETLVEQQAAKLGNRPNKDQLELMQMCCIALDRLLAIAINAQDKLWLQFAGPELLGALEDLGKQDSEFDREILARAAHNYGLYLGEAAYRLKLREHQIWRAHPTWELSGYEWDPNGPYDCRELINNRADALEKFDEEHPDVFVTLYKVWDCTRTPAESKPVFFVEYDLQERPSSFSEKFRELLMLRPFVTFENSVLASVYGKPAEDRCEISPRLTQERQQILNDFTDYLKLRANKAEAGSAEQRMWYEAAAELLSNLTGVYDAEAADRIIKLVNAAQRESWINWKMKGNGKPSAADRVPEASVLASEASDHPAANAPAAEDPLAKIGALLEKIVVKQAEGAPAKPVRKAIPRKAPLKGPKSPTMQWQLRAFARYVESHPISSASRATTVGARATAFWSQNAAEYERLAKQGGAKKGYSSAKALAGAYSKSQV